NSEEHNFSSRRRRPACSAPAHRQGYSVLRTRTEKADELMSKSLYIINPRMDFPSLYTMDALASQGLQVQHYGDLSITTVAGLVPPEFSVTLCEESVSSVDLDTPCDFVLITGKGGQNYRMLRLARQFRKRGKVVIIGGPFVSMNPDFLRPYCDVL